MKSKTRITIEIDTLIVSEFKSKVEKHLMKHFLAMLAIYGIQCKVLKYDISERKEEEVE
jgi:hypothetical protein